MGTYKRKDRKGFTLFHEHIEDIELLDNIEAGIILKAAFRYSIAGEMPDRFPDRMLNSVWNAIKRDIDYSIDAWTEKCTQNSYNAYRRIEKDNNREPLCRDDWEKTLNTEQENDYIQGLTSATHRQPSQPTVNGGTRAATAVDQYKIESELKVESEIEVEPKTEKEPKVEVETEWKDRGCRGQENQNNRNAQPSILTLTDREQRIAEIMEQRHCTKAEAAMIDSENYVKEKRNCKIVR